MMHCHTAIEEVVFKTFLAKIDKKTGERSSTKPRFDCSSCYASFVSFKRLSFAGLLVKTRWWWQLCRPLDPSVWKCSASFPKWADSLFATMTKPSQSAESNASLPHPANRTNRNRTPQMDPRPAVLLIRISVSSPHLPNTIPTFYFFSFEHFQCSARSA